MKLSNLVSPPFVYGSIAAALLLLGSAILAIRKGRRRNICWFCHAKQPKGLPTNGWTCVSCQQYNGFAEDGGYDREMTEQYADGELTPARFCRSDASVAPPTSGAAILCPQCQLSLEMKLVQLAAFQPSSEVYFEEEAEEYERSVEKLYPLCVSCEERVASEISRKNQIIRHHLLTTRKNHKAKAKPKVSREGDTHQWFFSLLTWTATVVSLWTVTSLLTQELYCSHGSQCGSLLVVQPAPLPPLLRSWDRVQLIEIAGGFSPAEAPLVEERNGTCQAKKRKLEWFNLMKLSPFHHDDHLGFCSVTTSMYFCMVTGFAFSQTLPLFLLLLTDIVFIFNRKWGSLLLLSVDTLALCTRPSLCYKLHLPTWAPFCSSQLESTAIVVAFISRLFVAMMRNLRRWKRSSYKEHSVGAQRLRSQPRVSVVWKEKSVPTQQVLHSSFVGMSIGQQARKKGIARKSWLQSLEEMNLLPPRHIDTTMAPSQGNKTSHTGSETELTAPTLDSTAMGGKPLLRPARLRHRRFSISSATAALSLENSLPWSHLDSLPNKEVWTSHPSEMLPNMEIETPPPPSLPCESTVRQVTFPDPDSTSGNETTQQNSPSAVQLQVKGHVCEWRWIVTVLLVASVASNLGLLGLLLMHAHPPW